MTCRRRQLRPPIEIAPVNCDFSLRKPLHMSNNNSTDFQLSRVQVRLGIPRTAQTCSSGLLLPTRCIPRALSCQFCRIKSKCQTWAFSCRTSYLKLPHNTLSREMIRLPLNIRCCRPNSSHINIRASSRWPSLGPLLRSGHLFPT